MALALKADSSGCSRPSGMRRHYVVHTCLLLLYQLHMQQTITPPLLDHPSLSSLPHSLLLLRCHACAHRLFAVGYAARQISSAAQLERLLSNPPMAAALQMVAVRAVAPDNLTPKHKCSTCQQLLPVGVGTHHMKA
jgi:hypothetical protein